MHCSEAILHDFSLLDRVKHGKHDAYASLKKKLLKAAQAVVAAKHNSIVHFQIA